MITTDQKTLFFDYCGLPVGVTINNENCPQCGESGSFSITNNGRGLLYNCFRVSCGYKGYIPFDLEEAYPQHKTKFTPKEDYCGPLDPLNDEQMDFLMDSFELSFLDIEKYGIMWAPLVERVCFNVCNEHGVLLGRTYRAYKELSKRVIKGPKTLHFVYKESNYFALHSLECFDNERIFIVEDPVSCIKVANCGVGAVALLSTHLSLNLIKKLSNKNVVMWLDRDAVVKASKYKKEFGIYFRSCRIVFTEKDPKDLSYNQIMEVMCGT